jgi:hypothetical protein
MMKASTVARTAEASRPRPAAIPTAADEQHSGLVWNQGKKCSAKGDEHMRPQSCLLPFLFPLEPQDTTE